LLIEVNYSLTMTIYYCLESLSWVDTIISCSHHWPTWCSWQKSWLSQYQCGIHTMPYIPNLPNEHPKSCHKEAGKITPRGPGGQWLGYSTNRLREVEKRTFEEMDERGTPPAEMPASTSRATCRASPGKITTSRHQGDHGDFTRSGYHGKFTMVHGWFRTVEMDMGDLYGFMGFIYHGPWLQDVTSGSEPLMMANWVVSCKGESRSHRGFQC